MFLTSSNRLALLSLLSLSAASSSVRRELPLPNSPCMQPQGNETTNPTGFLFELGDTPNNDFADPRLMAHDGKYYAYATNNYPTNKTNVPIAMSDHFRYGWSYVNYEDSLTPAQWESFNKTGGVNVWDPFVEYYEDGDHFVMYYAATVIPTANLNDTGTAIQPHCIGIATSSSPLGPFTGLGSKAFICNDPVERGRPHISPEIIKDNGTVYLVHKYGAAYGAQYDDPDEVNQIDLTQLDSTGTQIIAPFVNLYNSTRQDNDAEGPNIVKGPDGVWYLLYVTGSYQDAGYGIRYRSSIGGIYGPYDSEEQFLLQTGINNGVYLLSPGGPTFLDAERIMFMTTVPQTANCTDAGNNVRGPRLAKLKYCNRTISLAEQWDESDWF